MNRSSEKIFLWIIRICAGVILLLPLFIGWQTLYPRIFGKMIAFQALVEISLAAWVLLIILFKEYSPSWRNPVIWSLAAYVFVLLITMLMGVDPARSFWSTQERMTGVLNFLHYWAWALILSSTLRLWKEWRTLFFVSLFANMAVNIVGIAYPEAVTKVITSTLGNSIYVSAYAMMHVFLALFLFCMEKKKIVYAFLIGSVCLNIFLIMITGSRGVFFSFFGVLFVLGALLPFIAKSSLRKYRFLPGLALIGLLLVSGVGGWWLRSSEERSEWGQKNLPRTLSRVLYSQSAYSTADRLVLWKIGLQGFRERPLLGWGPENYGAIYEKYLIPRSFMLTWYEKSHSYIVDVLALTGVLGISAYLFFWGALFFLFIQLIRRNREGRSRIAMSVLGAFFVSYFLQNLTVFDSPAPLFLFFFVLSFVIFLWRKNIQSHYDRERQQSEPSTVPLAIVIPPIGIVLIFSLYFFNIAPLFRSMEGAHALLLFQKDPESAISLLEKSLSSSSFTNKEILSESVIVVMPLLVNANKTLPHSKKVQLSDFLIKKFEENLGSKQNSNNLKPYLILSALLLQTYKLTHVDYYLERAELTLSAAKELSPRRGEVFFFYTQLALLRNQYETAVQYAQESLKGISQSQRASTLWLLTQSFFGKKDGKQGLEALREAEQAGYPIYRHTDIALSMTTALLPHQKKEIQDVVQYMEKALQESPENITFQAARVLIYQKAGKIEESERFFEEIQKKNPEAARQIRELSKPSK